MRRGGGATFYGDRTHTTILDFQQDDQALYEWAKREKRLEKMGCTTIWSMKRDNVNEYKHPTQKPVELAMYALKNSSKAGDFVLDPFLGSGSTLIACQKMGRVCRGIELDPAFMDVIVERYVRFVESNEIIKNGKKILW